MTIRPTPFPAIEELAPYAPGLSIEEIRQRNNLTSVIKLASNENPLGVSPLAQNAINNNAASVFRYPRGGNPALAAALAKLHNVAPENIAIGNGSDEIIDLLIRIFASDSNAEILCFEPCFSIYPIQAAINGTKVVKIPLNPDFSFDLEGMLAAASPETRLVFITTPDNPSGYAPPLERVRSFAEALAKKAPGALLVIDEAYADFANDEKAVSLLANGIYPENTAFLRTFSKSYGLAGLRLGYAVLPSRLAGYYWRARLPFSVNLLVEAAGLAALEDGAFRETTLKTVREGRAYLAEQLTALGCRVWPSSANFLMFRLPENTLSAAEAHERLLKAGIIIRALKSYNLPEYLRVSVGNKRENRIFISELAKILASSPRKPAL